MKIKYLLTCLLALVPIAYSQDTGTNTATHDHATANEWFEKNVVTVNKAAGNFSGLLYDWTLTSAPGTDNRLIDFVVDTTSVFSMDEFGAIILGPSITTDWVGSGIRIGNRYGSPTIQNGSALMNFSATGAVNISGAAPWYSISGDVILTRDAAGVLAQRNGTAAQESRIYNTWTDASNGEWLEIGFQDTSNTAVIKTGANGTGTVRNLKIVAGKTAASQDAAMAFPISGSYSVGIYSPANYKFQIGMSNVSAGGSVHASYTGLQYGIDTASLSWGLTSQDVGISRSSAGVLAIGNGTAGNATGTIVAGVVKSGTYTVATLPAAGTAGAGATAFVSDGSVVHAGNSGSIVAGSGANFVPVYSDGTNWRIN
jgi:hypothetical protein